MSSFDDYVLGPANDPDRRIDMLFGLLANLYGPDKLVIKARKQGVVRLVKSSRVGERLLALQRLVFEDATLNTVPNKEDYPAVFARIEEELANSIAQRTVEMDLDQKVALKLRDRHNDYLNELRLEALKDSGLSENATTMKRLQDLMALEDKGLEASALSLVRPTSLDMVVGQERAISSLQAKIGTRYPQHVILYGPPGVGKTTVARLVLEHIKEQGGDAFAPDAPFVEVDATTIRWDPREIANPLLGSVHDPIYQGSHKELAEDAIPEPKIGLVTKAHGGVLFLDEIGELDPMLLNKLLKVLEDKRVYFESSYYDEDDPRVPRYVKHLFSEGAPADFILIGATTRQPEDIPLAIRSRCSEVYFEPLSSRQIEEIVTQDSKLLQADLEDGVAAAISEHTIEARKAVQILLDAYGLAIQRSNSSESVRITMEDFHRCARLNRLGKAIRVKAGSEPEVGRVFGLGVSGFLGSCLEIEAAVYPAHEAGKGHWRFNEAAGEMARDSVFNAGSVIRRLLDKDLNDYDVHVNVVGGGRIDGPSAGLAVTVALYSALQEMPLRSDIAMTGEVSIRGKVKPVGGIVEKLYGAMQAGMKRVIIPCENEHDVPEELRDKLEIVTVASVAEALEHLQ